MKVVIVAHGPPPDLDQPVSGGALRAAVHENALRGSGHDVVVLRRAQDEAGGFRSPADLRRRVTAARPDSILCVAVEEAWALRGLAPLCVDLYAPRLLEAAWEGTQSEQAGIALRAVHAADEVLFSNSRQRWFWLGILGLAGWDLSKPCGRMVPLACVGDGGGPSDRLEAGTAAAGRAAARTAAPRAGAQVPTPKKYLVAVGPRWPWQDPRAAIVEAVAAANQGRVEVRVYGPSSGIPGAREMGVVSRREWLGGLAGSLGLLDRYAPNAERELAVSFRQMDALAVGAPLITSANAAITAGLAPDAAWLDDALPDVLARLLRGERPQGFEGMAESFSPERTEAELLAWTPGKRTAESSVVDAGRKVASARASADADRALRQAAELEVAAKREEVAALHQQVRSLVSAVEASAAAVADVAAFRRETVAVLGSRLSGEQATREQLQTEVAALRADLEKKNSEIGALAAERDRLQRVFRWR